MKSFDVNSPTVLFNHHEHGTRLIFKNGATNPRDELGKNGVTTHHWFSAFFYQTIQIKADVTDKQGNTSKQTLYINRSSLMKYLGKKPHHAITDDHLIADLHAHLWDNLDTQKMVLEHQDGLRHAGLHQERKLNRFIDYIRGSFLGFLYQKTISSFNRIKLRFLVVHKESDILDAGETLAVKRFNEAYQSVPAYKKHIDNSGTHPQTFADIPLTDKSNYIKPQAYDADTHLHGKYPAQSKTDTSTGTTGTPTEWVRGQPELHTVKQSLKLAATVQFGDRKLHYINAFALGQWATGLTTYELMRETGSVFATGPNMDQIISKLKSIAKDEKHQLELAVQAFTEKYPSLTSNDATLICSNIEAVLKEALNDRHLNLNQAMTRQFNDSGTEGRRLLAKHKSSLFAMATQLNKEKQQIIIAGYPPFLKDLADYSLRKGHPLNDFSVMGVVGGQAISEALRDQLETSGFKQVYSSYGASDLDINLGVESDYEILVRKTIERNPGLARELYGANKGLPMVFHYDPMNYHVECNQDNKLIFTCARDDRSSPRIRYDLGDKGRVYASSDIQALLSKYGIFNKPNTDLPLMFVWGRDSTVVYRGANLDFTELERAVTSHADLEQQVLKKAFYVEGEHVEMWLELKEGVDLPTEEEATEYSQHLIHKLMEINPDFNYQIDAAIKGRGEIPTIRFYKHHTSPIIDADGHRKQVLVFEKGVNLARDYSYPRALDCSEVSLNSEAVASYTAPESRMR